MQTPGHHPHTPTNGGPAEDQSNGHGDRHPPRTPTGRPAKGVTRPRVIIPWVGVMMGIMRM